MSVRIASSIVAVAVVGIVASACKPKAQPCPPKFSAIAADKQALPEVQCTCDATNAGGSVWGSGVYTTDSSVCGAAVHAGAIPAAGGIAKSKKAAGCKNYMASAANGITSSGWGTWDTSFFFPGHGDGACPKVGDGGVCPAKIKDVPEAEMTCSCDKDATNGSVWGTGMYTTDSSVCAAAVHAGVITSAGGKVHVKKTTGCPSYAASAANGVSSSTWGSYDGSLYFPEKGDGKCGAGSDPDAACPSRYADIPSYTTITSFACKCPAGKPGGSVWGSGVYTHDSSICGAAIHVGAIPTTGGKVTLKSAAGCPKYKGTLGHGVMSSNWGSYGGSFYFSGNGDGSCSK